MPVACIVNISLARTTQVNNSITTFSLLHTLVYRGISM